MGELRSVSKSEVVMTEMVLPSHTNSLGTAFGGVIMSWIDIAAAISAQRHAKRPVVTASIDALHFVAPVHLGWVVNLKASVNRVFSTSMEVGVRIDAENPITGEYHHTATAYLSFVALDVNKKPIAIEGIKAESDEQVRRYDQAEERRSLRLQKKKIYQNK